ncbi:helix-hairpin-helix domain-containing protein [Belliella kenyensis]|uniref:Helix-hairpin-helix domain-containing protein n=1 Tax=Belliella kenyensis TaxID=1472724 RepID=A0ABV8END2_9BACT|nr:helix-hairpin-helix domain-containing protein [Belliella kenyensis]MCH7402963.1 helix-hairpin-helix domain-containing protein [Belliella kenyensis]MDN3604999.1 helix-hairpin-helix domain-containing protein [Belliella kenyensis]
MKSCLSILLLILCTAYSSAQTYRKGEINIETFIEDLFGVQQGEDEYEEIYEGLLQLFLNPIHLNKTNPEELKSIFILNPYQINSFFKYRDNFGNLISLYELQAIPGFDLETIYRILPFVTLSDYQRSSGVSLWKRIASERDGYFILRHQRVWEMRRGFTPADTSSTGRISSRYLGDPHNIYGRFRIQHSKDFSLGFTVDKDAGEQFIWDPQTKRYGFNFLSYHFTLYNQGRWKVLTIGDFQAQFGQGLVYGAGFSVGKGAETITTVRRSSTGLKPYTGAMEFGFFRGIGTSFQAGQLTTTIIASHAPRDGRVEAIIDTLDRQELIISSLQLSGLHRTPTEIAYKDQVRESNFGTNFQYDHPNKRLQIGLNTLYTRFSQSFVRNPQVYNQFEFSGQTNFIGSAYYSYNFRNYFFFGEQALSKSRGMGYVIGMMSSLSKNIDLSILRRKFDRNFHTFYGNAFSENTRPINEEGIYIGINFRPSIKYNWSIYYDQFKFPWLKFRTYAPSEGHEWMSRFTYKPSKAVLLFAQFREESKARNISEMLGPQTTYQLSQGKKWNYTVNLDYKINDKFSFKSRINGSRFDFSNNITKGYAISQDLNVDYQKWRISSRFVLFDTDNFDNRQYIYERNVLWAFSIPALHGQGYRYYLLGQYKLNQKLTFWARFARTTYTDREQIGSGLQTIQGSVQTETIFQLRYQFNR